jgi:hypothetical protein
VTFVNDERLYLEMRDSFERAGFTAPIAVFERATDASPYAAVSRLGQSAETPYVILCHQDVRCDLGHDASHLIEILNKLTKADPTWAVAGNAGGTTLLSLVRNLRDPHGDHRARELPRRVVSLDENLMILRTDRRPRSSQLSTFHLYGTDVCLNVANDGGSAYVIDFRVTHLSGGGLDGYDSALEHFADYWRPRFAFKYVRTTNSLLFFSRHRWIRRLFGNSRLIWRLDRLSLKRSFSSTSLGSR